MPPPALSTRKPDRKVSVSFTNWVLGGSLVSLESTDGDTRRVSGRRVILSEIDKDNNETLVRDVDNPKIEKRSKTERDGKKEEKKGDAGKKDGDDKKKDGGEKKKDGKDDKKDKKKDGGEKKKDGEGDKKDKNKDRKKCKSCGKELHPEDDDHKQDAKKDGSAEKKGDEKKSDQSKGKSNESKDKSDHSKGGGSGWTRKQDSKLREMKAANKSWKEITAETGFSKQDATKRFKELQTEDKVGYGKHVKDDSDDSSDDSISFRDWQNLGHEGSSWGQAFKDGGSKKDKKGSDRAKAGGSSWDKGGDDADIMASFEDLFLQDAQSSKPEKRTSSWNNGNNADINKSNKHGKGNTGDANDLGANLGGASTDANVSFGQPKEQERPQSKLRPGGVWSKEDCEVLETLEQQYRDHKWLHIQANFYNWAGKMIGAEMIEKKFREDGAA